MNLTLHPYDFAVKSRDGCMQGFYDVAIVGAGPAGLCLARNLSKLGLSVALLEKQSRYALETPAVDGRDIALTHFSRKMLEELGVWDGIPADAISIIREARVFDGASLRYMELSCSRTDQLAFIVSNHHIRAAAYAAVKDDANITLLDSTSLERLGLNGRAAIMHLSDGKIITCNLAVAADSRFSETRRKAGISASIHDFGKTMIVCQMAHDHEHKGVAHECFHHGHTLAVLPLHGNRSSVIITLTPAAAETTMKMPAHELNAWVAEQFQQRLGNMRLDSERFAYPLVGVYADRFMAQRFALVGDAAVGMHPVTAHGFNFGLRSVSTLCEGIRGALHMGSDIASADVLVHYERRHKRTTRPLYLATSGIVSLYTNDSVPAQIARKVFLRAADHMLPIKSMLMAKLTEKEFSGSFGIPSPLGFVRQLFKSAA